MMEDLQGTLLKGYKLEERIGSGGFGAVYRAKQTTIGREVAIKCILPGFANHPDFIRRFESEAHLIARLEHPHITPLYDFWRDPSGAYLVMRHLRGGSIRDALETDRFELPVISQLLDQIASALDFAHRNKVIHRDIKPGNILLDEDGNTYLADFGIAKDLSGVTDNKTAADAVVGSLDYLSPEQARNEPVTPQTDVYSLGVILYELITGEHPFKSSSTIERLYKHINDPLPEIDNLPDNLLDPINEIIQKATEKNPKDRYPDVLALAVAFRESVGLGTRQGVSIVEQLTMREQEILSLIADGLSNREIADKLVVTVGTVKWHIKQLYKKLGVRSRVQAIVRGRELDLIVTGDTAEFLPDTKTSLGSISLPAPENPYKGLHAFQMTDAHDFFGRDELTQKLIDKMCDDDPFHRFLAIVGPSGSGKSSLVKAGLIPALWKGTLPGSEKWFVVDMMPGTHPLDKLETALIRVAANQTSQLREQLQRDERGLLRVADIILPGDDTELVIVVDQFEEVFTLVEDESMRQQFLDLLRIAISDVRSRIRVIVTLRADYYDRPLHYPEFGELIRNRMETVLPLTAKGLERAVRGPAERVGITFEQGLVEQIVSQMNYQAGALPLLQYALTELFDRREGRLLTNQAYQDIGGAVGALANRADEIYRGLTEDGQELAHQMFMRLVTLGDGAEDTRRRATHAELLSLTENTDLMEEVIDQFAGYRLLSLDHDAETRQPTVEVAHEAILREWDRLRQWLNESRDDIRQERAVSRAADDWNQHNRDTSYLLRGTRLEQINKWQQTTALVQTPLEQEFITKSLEQHEKEVQAERIRKDHEAQLEQRSRNFLRGLVAVFAIATLIAGGLALFAFIQRNDAIQARDAEALALQASERSAEEFRSVALAFGAQDALNNSQPHVALALAQESIKIETPPPAVRETFYDISSSIWIQDRLFLSDVGLADGEFHPDGERFITTGADGQTIVWDIETGLELQSIQREDRAFFFAINPQGNIVVVAGPSGILQIWNLETDEVTEHMYYDAPAFNSDGSVMVTANFWAGVATIFIWETKTFTVVDSFEAHTDFIPNLTFSSDDSLLISVSGGWDGTVKVWDFDTHDLLRERQFGNGGIVWDAIMLSDDERILVASSTGEVSLWDWRTDEIIWVTTTHESSSAVQDIDISPDEQTFALSLNEGAAEAQLREVASGELIHAYKGHSLRVQQVDFSPDGETILSTSSDGSIIFWPTNWEGAMQTVHVNSNNLIVWHPTRPLIATVGTAHPTIVDTTIRLIDTTTGQVIHELVGHENTVRGLAFSPDGNYLISGGWDTDIYVWDIETGQQSRIVAEDEFIIMDLTMNDDGQFAIPYGERETQIVLFDYETGERIATFDGHTDQIFALEYSPDGELLYSGARNAELYQWDIETGEIIQEFVGHLEWVHHLDVNSDGGKLVSASADHTAIVWDTSTGETLMTLHAHTDEIIVAEFSPDDNLIMTASLDGRVILWDAETGELVYIFVLVDESFQTVATFSPDGTQIVSSANDILTFWDITNLPDDYESWVQDNRYIPDFTCEQRILYTIEPLCEVAEQ
jgi:WD40 repeat protein/DNA-binding CsgD family transcriptional regulator